MDAFAATRLAAGTAFLVVAAASDLRTRRVRDPLWIVLGTLGLVVLASQLLVESAPWSAWSFAASAALLFYAVFFGRPLTEEDGFHARPIRIALFLVAGVMWIAPFALTGAVPAAGSTPALASTPVMIVGAKYGPCDILRGRSPPQIMRAPSPRPASTKLLTLHH